MEDIIGALFGLINGAMVMKLCSDRERLSDSEFAIAVVVSLVCFAFIWAWFCGRWVDVREFFNVPIFPEWSMSAYTPEEMAWAPFLDGAIFYSPIFLWLKLKNYPEWLKTYDEIFAWQQRRRWWYAGILLGLAVLLTARLAWIA